MICFSSPHLFSSQALSDAHFQVSPEIFDWAQAQAVAGPLKDIHRVVYKPLLLCLGSLSCWKVNRLPSLRLWMLWTGFSWRLSQYIFVYWTCLLLWRVPAPEKQPHSMRLLPAHFTFGMSSACDEQCLLSFKHNTWNWGSSDQIILFLTVWGSLSSFFANSKCVFMCLH